MKQQKLSRAQVVQNGKRDIEQLNREYTETYNALADLKDDAERGLRCAGSLHASRKRSLAPFVLLLEEPVEDAEFTEKNVAQFPKAE
jgi:hypothetical protein